MSPTTRKILVAVVIAVHLCVDLALPSLVASNESNSPFGEIAARAGHRFLWRAGHPLGRMGSVRTPPVCSPLALGSVPDRSDVVGVASRVFVADGRLAAGL